MVTDRSEFLDAVGRRRLCRVLPPLAGLPMGEVRTRSRCARPSRAEDPGIPDRGLARPPPYAEVDHPRRPSRHAPPGGGGPQHGRPERLRAWQARYPASRTAAGGSSHGHPGGEGLRHGLVLPGLLGCPMKKRQRLAERLRSFRAEVGLSQVQMARRLGLSRSTLQPFGVR